MDSSMVGSEMALPGGFSGKIAARGARTICVALSTQLYVPL